MLSTAYPFLDVLWTMVAFFLLAIWVWLLFTVWADLFRRHDISVWAKVAWLLLTLLFPFVGVFVYVITQRRAMDDENVLRPRLP